MAPSSSQAAKQTSIASFFVPKSGSSTPKKTVVVPPEEKKDTKRTSKKSTKESSETRRREVATKSTGKKRKTLDRDENVDDGDFQEEDIDMEHESDISPEARTNIRKPSSKRPLAAEDSNSPSNNTAKRARTSISASPPPIPSSHGERTKITGRTAKFQFGSQAQREELDPASQKRKEELHEKYVRKLGRGSAIRAGPGRDVEHEDLTIGSEGEEEEEEEPAPVSKKGKGPIKPVKKKKLTPMEQQVIDLKRQHPDVLLVVEVGYKFRFFGEDARVAAKELSIVCIPGKMRFDEHSSEAHLDKFASASIPVHRLHVHVKRLVEAGHKVGVVRQLETAALKAVGDNKNKPFERKLTNLYTKGTYIDDVDGLSDSGSTGGAPNTGFLLCITEKPGGGSGTDEKCRVGIVAVQPSTGDIIYDEFDDGFMRSEIETRLLHISPCEFLIVGELTPATNKLIKHLAGSASAIGAKVRVERVNSSKGIAATSAVHISQFYSSKLDDSSSEEAQKKNALLEAVMGLPELVTICLSCMIKHLTDYGLEHVFDLTKYFQSFSARSHMLLNGNTLSSLEIYQNQTDYTEKGSLFWTLDRTKTKFGRRLLRNWVGRPLLDKKLLEQRVEAVEEFFERQNPKIETLRALLTKINYDLEKGLIRIYYGKCTRPEVLTILQTMLRVVQAFPMVEDPKEYGFRSELIAKSIAALPVMEKTIEAFLKEFNHQSAGKDDKYSFFKEEFETERITEHKCAIAAIEADLLEHRKDIAKMLGRKKVEYVTVSQVEYLVEVSNDKQSMKLVPANWIKENGTKKLSRFHTPEVKRLMAERDQHKESLAAACDDAFKAFLARISEFYQQLRDTVQSLALLDCLLSLATVAAQPDYCKPKFVDEPVLNIVNGRHPMIERLMTDAYVPNSISLSSNSLRALLVTGPNMGGKSSYVRQNALIAIMAQIGSFVPAESAELGLLDAVFTRMGAFDNLLAGESTFMVELSETSDILKAATPRSLVILDELGRGTSTQDGVAIAYAVLEHMVRTVRSMTLFVTHYPILGAVADQWHGEVGCVHMKFEKEDDGGEENITFLYQVENGLAYRSYGLNVARLAGLPESTIKLAGVKSRELEDKMRIRERVGAAKMIDDVLRKGETVADDVIERLGDVLAML